MGKKTDYEIRAIYNCSNCGFEFSHPGVRLVYSDSFLKAVMDCEYPVVLRCIKCGRTDGAHSVGFGYLVRLEEVRNVEKGE